MATLRLKSFFQALAVGVRQDWRDLCESIPFLVSGDADGGTAVAAYVDTSTAWSTSGAKLFSWRNNAVEKAYLTYDGSAVLGVGAANPTLRFGGTTSSYPMWKRSGAQLHARLADDSGGADIDFGGTLNVGGTQVARFAFATEAWFAASVLGFTTAYSQKGMFVATTHALMWQDGGGAGNACSLFINRPSSAICRVTKDDSAGAAMELIEMTAPSAPSADGCRLYAEDNGSGKTRLMALFSSGAAQQVAIQP